MDTAITIIIVIVVLVLLAFSIGYLVGMSDRSKVKNTKDMVIRQQAETIASQRNKIAQQRRAIVEATKQVDAMIENVKGGSRR